MKDKERQEQKKAKEFDEMVNVFVNKIASDIIVFGFASINSNLRWCVGSLKQNKLI